MKPSPRQTRLVLLCGTSLALAGGCTLVADFSDRTDGDAGVGTAPTASGPSIIPGQDGGFAESGGGRDGSLPSSDGATTDVEVPDGGPEKTCVGKTDGTPYENDFRCCGQAPMVFTSDQHCGACGIACRTDLGHHCQNVFGHFICTGCGADGGGGNGACWTGCCAGNACIPENVVTCGLGVCSDSICRDKAPQSGCNGNPVTGIYCSY